MSLPADPCPYLWIPPCECPLGPFHRPACPWFNPGLDPAPADDRRCPACGAIGCRCAYYAPDCPPDHGCLADEYDWLVPDGPEDPDRYYAGRDSGE